MLWRKLCSSFTSDRRAAWWWKPPHPVLMPVTVWLLPVD
jgi:hypothetical protein